jgi:hypothetical protein
MHDIFPKFIVEGNNLIIGRVTYHEDLVTDKEQVKGGGWWKIDGKIMTFWGDSFDFGKANIEDIRACIDAGNVWGDKYEIENITNRFTFEYKEPFGEIIKLN